MEMDSDSSLEVTANGTARSLSDLLDAEVDLSEQLADGEGDESEQLWSELKMRNIDMSLPDIYVATDVAILQYKMGLWDREGG